MCAFYRIEMRMSIEVTSGGRVHHNPPQEEKIPTQFRRFVSEHKTMKHGTRIWEKKLGRSPTHRKSLLINLLTQLVKHEQIETTVAKAQFLKHEMEKVILIHLR
jgi:hypothetical protein